MGVRGASRIVLVAMLAALAGLAPMPVALAQATTAGDAGGSSAVTSIPSAADLEKARQIFLKLTPAQQAALTALAARQGKTVEEVILGIAGSAVMSTNLGDPGEDVPPPPPPPSGNRDKVKRTIATLTPDEQANLNVLASQEKMTPEDLWLSLLGSEIVVGTNLGDPGEGGTGSPSAADLEKARQYILKLPKAQQDALKARAQQEGVSPEALLLTLVDPHTMGTDLSEPGEDDGNSGSSGTGGTGSGSTGGTGGSTGSSTGTGTAAQPVTATPKVVKKKIKKKKVKRKAKPATSGN